MSSQTATIDEILERYPGEPRYLISLLQDIQAEYGYVSNDAMTLVCDHAGVPISRAWSVTTFYKSFSTEPQGEHHVKVCQGTACHLKHADQVLTEIKEELGEEGEAPGFHIEQVRCLGCCTVAPAVEVNGEIVDKDSAKNTITKLKGEK